MTIVRSGVSGLLVITGLLLAGTSLGWAQEAAAEMGGRRSVAAFRIAEGESIELDGRLDEAIWARAVPAAGFTQIDPANGQPATEQTEVRIAFDSDTLYMGVTAYDSEPDKLLASQMRRDQGLGSDDRFMWVIDTFLDGRTGYFFEMNPAGLLGDGLMGTSGGNNKRWDGIWNARVGRSEIGWTLEIAIPFRTLNFDPNSDTWGINFQRTVRRKNEESIWTGFARNQGLRRMNNAGLVTGIRDVSQGHGLDIKPYGLFTSEASPGLGSPATNLDANAGLDIFYNPTPQLRTNLTINTDFAQTEVDQRQVNLTRFSLFFEERRDFFLDGGTFFDFASTGDGRQFRRGGGGDRILPFHSRRIGLSEDRAPQKIDFGTKITGQMGGQDVGVLHVRTGGGEGLVSEDFTVARVKRRLFQQSYVGGMYTRRGPRNGGDARQTAGLDARFSTSSFLGSENLETNLWLLHAAGDGAPGDNLAYGATLIYPNDRWDARLAATEVQENFTPEVGFVTRRAYRKYTPSLQFSPRPANHRYIRRFRFGSSVDVRTDLRNDVIERRINLTLLEINLHSQDSISFSANQQYERLDEPFEITDDITLPLGASYTFSRYRIFGRTAPRRVLSVNARYETGDFYSGTRTDKALTLTVRARTGMIIRIDGQWNAVELPEGHFSTRLYRLNAETQFSPFVALVNNVQYDSQSAVIGWQSRFRWTLTPGNDLYVVYTHNWLDEPLLGRFATQEKRLASKVLYTYRF